MQLHLQKSSSNDQIHEIDILMVSYIVDIIIFIDCNLIGIYITKFFTFLTLPVHTFYHMKRKRLVFYLNCEINFSIELSNNNIDSNLCFIFHIFAICA